MWPCCLAKFLNLSVSSLKDEEMDKNIDEIVSDEALQHVHMLDYQFFSKNKSDFPSGAVAVFYMYNTEVFIIMTAILKRLFRSTFYQSCYYSKE